MSIDPLTASLAAAVRGQRERRGLSAAGLAQRSGVSRAMIGKIERGDAQPSAVLLARLAAAFELTLSEMIAAAEAAAQDAGEHRLTRRDAQPLWRDPVTGYTRRSVSPAAAGPLQLAEIELPPGAEVAYPAGAYPDHPQEIVVLAGTLVVGEGGDERTLAAGDCLRLGPAGERRYVNRCDAPARYLVATARA